MSASQKTMADFAKGMGMGLMVGTAAGMMMKSKKKSGKRMVSDAVKAVGDFAETVADTMGW